MAFEDLQKAFVEVELEKLKAKGIKLKAIVKKTTKGGKKIGAKKKLGSTKVATKSKEKVDFEKIEKEKGEVKKLAKDNEIKKDGKKEDKKPGLSSPSPYETPVDPKSDLALYQQKFYLAEDPNRVSSLDQLEVINKLPKPENAEKNIQEKKQPDPEGKQKAYGNEHHTIQDRAKLIREALDHGATKASLKPAKTPLMAEKAAQSASVKDSGASMNAILALHSDKNSK